MSLVNFLKYELLGLPRKIYCGKCNQEVNSKDSWCSGCGIDLRLKEVIFE